MKKFLIRTSDIFIFVFLEFLVIFFGLFLYESILEPQKEHLADWEEELVNYTEDEEKCFLFYKDHGYLLTYCEIYRERFEIND